MTIRDDLISLQTFAEEMGVTRRTVERWHAQRIGPPRIKIGKQVFYRRESISDWIIAHEQTEPRAAGRV
ncbi:helix-turn-helix transcriptional regulator [Spiribacter vilamensis]|uniref:Helix-turn-helix protein n=1 Tax=Spiribacter vilamensis TaxID=531306 RepID=A0A4Q8D0J0_9GAMM|nr:helix-turn-helix domain-containing protein [Spiribacter vilamensis]RZU98782.1 helix-turn-helix protein [Spiribacter vilamensis]TVO62197.1 helix-turn-helix domain-containing protein [Spiribacter vilamensis]